MYKNAKKVNALKISLVSKIAINANKTQKKTIKYMVFKRKLLWSS